MYCLIKKYLDWKNALVNSKDQVRSQNESANDHLNFLTGIFVCFYDIRS